ACRIDVGDLLHRFGDLEVELAAPRGGQPVGQEHALARPRLVVDARARRRAHAADAEDVGDEREMRSVEREQHRTTRQLPLRLLDRSRAAGPERKLGLKDAVGPGDRHEVDLWRASGAEGERLQALTESGLLPVGIDDRPPRAGARRDLRADPRYVRTNLWAVASASAQRHADERQAAGTRPPEG